eukprot:TRINITY_DN2266_c0_g1_i1.p1 TRINITY_DN2266_c0_g1~~TRINITY_DN2266_c0_g1_i1.p1  ORF type:complete len:114 (+),score=4.60 TRINITY_DN2266_c0_g1_i1:50-391(+)
MAGISKSRRVKNKIQEKVVQLGEFEYLLYQLSIYIGKLRAVYFYKDEKCGKTVGIIYAVIGLFCMLLPLRVNYAIIVLLMFSLKPLMVIKQKRGRKEGELDQRKVKYRRFTFD